MSEQKIQQFIFKAGFSTAQNVTSVSGRGVGMDVVCTNIEKIGGTVDLTSREGVGSTFTIKIPLTLAIVSALIVQCAGERFAVPQISVVELVRVSEKSEHRIETINDAPVLRLRDRILPLVSLRGLLDLNRPEPGQDGEVAPNENFIIVTHVGTYTFGIVVDGVYDTEEIVVKPVAPILRHISMISGNTILGDGSVIMILDPNGIAAASGDDARADSVAQEAAAVRDQRDDEAMALLLFRAGDASPKAVPLALVARLEEIEVDKIEWSGGRPLVQYRGQLMPLITIDDSHALKETGLQPILVFSDGDHSMGLAVDEIIDIVEDTMHVELSADRPGFIGSAIVNGAATDIVDTGVYLGRAFDNWFGCGEAPLDGAPARRTRVLLVDDSPFFRNLLAPLLDAAGYQVTTVESADKALRLCAAGEDFDIIISDIEMPGMNGFQFAEAVRDSGRWRETPMVALSSHTSPRDIDRGREVGFDDYVAKFDRDSLLETIDETLAMNRGAA